MTALLKDLPRDQLLGHAIEFMKKARGGAIYFKFTCADCGTRCTLEKPNTLYEKGKCCKCGHITTITEGGYMYVAKGTL